MEAARELIADVPPVRDELELKRLAVSRLGKQVIDVVDVDAGYADAGGAPKQVLSDVTWLIGAGDRYGLLGENGAGKSTLLDVIQGKIAPTRGRVKIGQTVRFGVLSQQLEELEPYMGDTIREVLSNYKKYYVIDGKETSPEKLCERLGIPMNMLPTPVPSSMVYGRVTAGLSGLEALEGVPVCGSAGDQAAALLGQACIEPGQAKNTYGTGCFTLMNTGNKSVRSVSGLVTSVAWSVNGETTYALEGSVFNAGSSIQWLRDELGIIGAAHECDLLAESVPDNGGVYLVSAFTGLGAPRWDMYARGAIVGLTRGSNKAHIARATLEGIAYQVKDLLDAMQIDAESPISVLRVDGGASVSSFLMQFQADMLRVPIDRPKLVETTAFGAAFLAGLASGVWESVDDIALLRQSDRIFKPEMDAEQAKRQHDNWLRAVGRAEKWSLE